MSYQILAAAGTFAEELPRWVSCLHDHCIGLSRFLRPFRNTRR